MVSRGHLDLVDTFVLGLSVEQQDQVTYDSLMAAGDPDCDRTEDLAMTMNDMEYEMWLENQQMRLLDGMEHG